ncbi:MAG: EscU/YscU/HrcU family type III secretion system export apparatus switch protein [Myxococcaceae bacterium]|nr:EscU/YscU/HrcU family type III secretion system export apparatus switch protein [Myxococcaceae bacterium]
MSDDHDPESKTEAASERKLQQLAEDGQIPLGRDVAAAGAFAAGLTALIALAGQLGPMVIDRIVTSVTQLGEAPKFEAYLPVLGIGFGVVVAAALGGAIPMVVQTKGRFWSNLAVPDPSRLWKLERVTRIFKAEGLTDLGVAALKVAFFAFAARWAFTGAFPMLANLLDAPTEELASAWLKALTPMALKLLGAVVAVAAVDLFVQRHKFAKEARMTREDARREHKEDEGDPMLKGRRKKKARELAKHRVAIDVPRADAVIVNPTHIAIAVRYRRDEGGAPRVLAKGKGALAEVIRDIARANGIAIVQDIPLARLLHKRVRVGQFVPKETFKAVATVLAHVYKLQQRK